MKLLPIFTAALMAAPSIHADSWFDSCKYSERIDMTLDLSGSDKLALSVGAGDLEVQGQPGSTEAVIRGKICVSDEDWLEDAGIESESGTVARISTVLPDRRNRITLFGSNYAYIDLEIDVPEGIDVDINDSSGDISVSDLGAVNIRDSSGDIDLEDVAGPVDIEDTSGDIEALWLENDLIVSDSSGDIEARNVKGSVRIVADSSGDMVFRDVEGDVIVERDSSGDIDVRRVAGDFVVERDSSGDIASADVSGNVDIPKNKR